MTDTTIDLRPDTFSRPDVLDMVMVLRPACREDLTVQAAVANLVGYISALESVLDRTSSWSQLEPKQRKVVMDDTIVDGWI